MTSLETLVKVALLGTGRDSTLPALDGPLRPFGESKAGAETALLHAAAALTTSERAGRLPARGQTPAIPLCPPETQLYFSPRAAALLDGCLSGQRELVPQALRWAAQSGQIAPPALLPRLLELGRGSKELRRFLAPILGERGRWLAQLNPDWRQVAAPLDADLDASWQEGEIAARREALRLKRETEPEAAREWIETAFKTEGAKERALSLETLEIGLSSCDEPFLESVLSDKSREVRVLAVSLLEKLPDSRLIERAKVELEPLLRWNAEQRRVEVELPAAWKKEWARDGLEEKLSPYNRVRNLGEKAAWLQRFLERVPPSHWEAKWQVSPAQIVAGAPKEWHELLIGAWWEAAKMGGDRAWMEAIATQTELKTLRNTLNLGGFTASNADHLALLLWERGEQKLLEADDNNGPLRAILLNHPGPWSAQLARLFLQSAREIIAQPPKGAHDYRSPAFWLRHSLAGFADKIPTQMLAEAAQGWPDDELFQQNWAPVITHFLARLQLRADLQSEFSPASSSSP